MTRPEHAQDGELARRERMAEIGNFSMIIAHELKNPLGIIKGSIDIIAKEGVKSKVRKTMIEYIPDEVKRLNRLVEDFLSFARPNPAHKSLINVNQVVNKMIAVVPFPEFNEKQIDLQVQTAPDLYEVNADEHQIYQALLNILSNAVQAIPDRGEIMLRTENRQGGILVSVTDTSRYYDWDPGRGSIAIGYTFLTRDLWGGPANAEMKRLMLELAFRWVQTVWFHVGPRNIRSQKALEKIGAQYSHHEVRPGGGTLDDRLFYRLDAPDFR